VDNRDSLRLAGIVWWLHLKMFSVSAFEGFMQIVWPLIFATSALLIVRTGGDDEAPASRGSGAAAMGIWSAMTPQPEHAPGTALDGHAGMVVAAPRASRHS